jgi:hypothetical protein
MTAMVASWSHRPEFPHDHADVRQLPKLRVASSSLVRRSSEKPRVCGVFLCRWAPTAVRSAEPRSRILFSVAPPATDDASRARLIEGTSDAPQRALTPGWASDRRMPAAFARARPRSPVLGPAWAKPARTAADRGAPASKRWRSAAWRQRRSWPRDRPSTWSWARSSSHCATRSSLPAGWRRSRRWRPGAWSSPWERAATTGGRSPTAASTPFAGASASTRASTCSRRLMRGEVVDHRGAHFTLEHASIADGGPFRPWSSPAPVVQRSLGRRDTARAGSACCARPQRFRETREEIGRRAVALDRPTPDWFGLNVWCAPARSPDRSRRELAASMARWFGPATTRALDLYGVGDESRIAAWLGGYAAAGATRLSITVPGATAIESVERVASLAERLRDHAALNASRK